MIYICCGRNSESVGSQILPVETPIAVSTRYIAVSTRYMLVETALAVPTGRDSDPFCWTQPSVIVSSPPTLGMTWGSAFVHGLLHYHPKLTQFKFGSINPYVHKIIGDTRWLDMCDKKYSTITIIPRGKIQWSVSTKKYRNTYNPALKDKNWNVSFITWNVLYFEGYI